MLAQTCDSFRVELVKATGTCSAVEHQACIFEDLQVLGNGGAADGKRLGEFIDGERTRREFLEDRHAGGVAESIETGLKVCVHLVSQ